ncbi:MAG TPA: FtsW/RodA/SpoVE family cell cycle protein [Limnochordales bacterium]
MSLLSWRARIESRPLERSLLAAALVPCGLLIALSRWVDGGWSLGLGLLAGHAALFLALHTALALVRPTADAVVLPLVALLSGVCLAMLARLDAGLAVRQLCWLAAGGVLLVAAAAVGPVRLSSRAAKAMAVATVSVLAVTALFGTAAGGARSWLVVGPLRFQPVEAAKVVLVWCWARWLSPSPAVARTLLVAGLASLALVVQRELGYPLLLLATAVLMVYIAAGNGRSQPALLGAVFLAAFALVLAVNFAAGKRWFPHLPGRLVAWLDPWADPFGAGFQALQGLFALAEGGLLGRGIGVGSPQAVPAVHTDYLLAAVGEELGFLGTAAVLVALALFVARALWIAGRALGETERLLAAGLGLVVGLQALWMAGALVRALPLSGVGLPLLSYGGSATLAHMAAAGLLLATSAGLPASARDGTQAEALAARRVRLVGWGLAAGAAAVIVLFGYWQTLRADLRTHPLNPRFTVQSLAARGGIRDRHGEALAETRTAGAGMERRLLGPASLSHVVGYVDPRFGLAGIEAARQADLAGLDRGLVDWWRDPLRRRPEGKDVWLTIDARVQAAAERALGHRRGAVVAIRPQTGEVLAMASYPAFAPEELPRLLGGGEHGGEAPLLNRAVQGLYPPGSTFKVLTLAAAFDAGLIRSPQELEALQRALAASSNEPFANLGLQLGARELAAVASRVGFGSRLVTDLPHAVSPLPGAVKEGDLAQISIGQGELVATPLQMAVVAAAIAHGGVAMRPHLVREVRTRDGRIAHFTRVEPLGPPAFSPAAARAVTEGMVLAVEEGTARQAALDGVRVAGKTGTAQNPHGEAHAWFIGFAPAFRPEIAVAVIVEGGGSGGQVAAPVGREVMLSALEAMRAAAEVN